MGSDIDQRTASLELFVQEYAPGRNGTPSQSMCFRKIDLTQFSGFTGSMERLCIAAEPVLITDRKLLPGSLPGVQHLLRVRRVLGHRFLTHDVFARLKSRNRDRTVGNIRRTDMHDVDLQALVRQHLFVIRKALRIRNPVFLRGLFGSLRNKIAERHHLRPVRIGLERRHMLPVRNTAASYNRDSQLSHFPFLLF